MVNHIPLIIGCAFILLAIYHTLTARRKRGTNAFAATIQNRLKKRLAAIFALAGIGLIVAYLFLTA